MSYNLKHIHKDNILHVTLKGTLSHANHLDVWKQIFDLSQGHTPIGILLECILSTQRISMTHCFEMIDRLPLLSSLLNCRVALCETESGDEVHDLFRFVETAAQDRGANLRFFNTAEDARLWLSNSYR